MNAAGVALVLTPEERQLVEALREVPESPLRRKMVVLLRALFSFTRAPRCPEAQPDGVPCENPAAQCDQCARITRVLDNLARRVTEQDGNG
ncbi:MAG TPA: hypothetical protein VF580_07055 [Thermoanaerobaculia bacterium]|jgi:hypothetical protein